MARKAVQQGPAPAGAQAAQAEVPTERSKGKGAGAWAVAVAWGEVAVSRHREPRAVGTVGPEPVLAPGA
jgi:hypothetical protein